VYLSLAANEVLVSHVLREDQSSDIKECEGEAVAKDDIYQLGLDWFELSVLQSVGKAQDT